MSIATASDGPTVETTHPQAEQIDRLRRAADFLEQHPDLHQYPIVTQGAAGIFLGCYSRQEITDVIRQLGGHWDKYLNAGMNAIELTQVINGVNVKIHAPRQQTCEARVISTKPVTETRVTDPERAAELQAELDALTEEVVVGEREIVEWDCAPVLAEASR